MLRRFSLHRKQRQTGVPCAILTLAMAISTIGSTSSAEAATITWTLQNVTFAGGQTATGSFTLDQSNGSLIDWDIQVTGGLDTLTNVTFVPGGNCLIYCGAGVSPSGLDISIDMSFRTPLATDNTLLSLSFYLQGTVHDAVTPSAAGLVVDQKTLIDRELFDPNPIGIGTLKGLDRDFVNTAANPLVVLAEAPSGMLLLPGLIGLMVLMRRRGSFSPHRS